MLTTLAMRRFSFTAFLTACCAVAAFAADDAAAPKSGARDALKARIAAEDAKAKSAPRPTPAPGSSTAPKAAASPTTPAAPAPFSTAAPTQATASTTSGTPSTAKKNAAAPTPAAATAQATPADPAPATNATTAAKTEANPDTLLLPQIDVRRDPIEIKEQYDLIYEQEKKILAEKRKTKPTETDKALNDPRVSKALSVFGGESSDYRANLAKERVSLMEDENDLREALVLAKTPEEKKELQKQIDELRALRRDLEKSLR